MEKQYSIEIIDRITKIQLSASPTYDLVVKIIDELAEKDIYKRRLWDLSKVDFDWDSEDLRRLADYGKKIFRKPNKAAFYAPKDLAFGEMRQFEVFRTEEDHSAIMVFRDETKAMKWLNS